MRQRDGSPTGHAAPPAAAHATLHAIGTRQDVRTGKSLGRRGGSSQHGKKLAHVGARLCQNGPAQCVVDPLLGACHD